MRKNARLVLSILIVVVLVTGGFSVAAEEENINDEMFLDEEGMFSEEEMIMEEDMIVSDGVEDDLNRQRLGVSYELATGIIYNEYGSPDWFGRENEDEIYNNLTSNILFDARFGNGSKSFLNIEASYCSNENEDGKNTDINVKEFFVDTHWQNRVYIRTGKQVLKWGRSYFWNPTDLINIKKKDFFDMEHGREGTNGFRVHVPYGVEKNIYLFIGLNEFDDINKEELSLAGKYEFLIGNTEMAFSAWDKKGRDPVYGFDISGRVSDIDLRGEISLAREIYALDYNTLEFKKEAGNWIPKISAGFTKNFDHGDINDRISLTGELYYNHAGYDKNIFTRIEGINEPQERLNLKSRYLQEIYEPYRNSKYYLALFSSLDKFIVSDLILNLNGIANLIDESAILTAGLRYNPRTNVYIDFNINRYLGDKYTEANFMGNDISYELGTTVAF